VYLSKDTLGGSDATPWLTSLSAGDWVLISTGVGIEIGWRVVSIANHTSWFDIAVNAGSYSGPAGPLSLGDSGFVTVSQERSPGAASTVGVTPAGGISSTNVQAALQELDGDIDTRIAAALAGSNHNLYGGLS
jgi:hypothetical protein